MGEIADHYVGKMQSGKSYSDFNFKPLRSSTMQVTGQILKVVPNMKDGYPETFTTTNGQFYVFNMAIQQPGGPLCGTINSKSPQYPLAAGTEITVEQSLGNQNEVKFKKINLQYQQGQQQAPQQGQQQPTSKDRLIVTQVVYKSLLAMPNPVTGNLEADLRAGVDMIMRVGENKPVQQPQQQAPPQQQQQAPPQQAPPQYDPNAAFDPTDDIPF